VRSIATGTNAFEHALAQMRDVEVRPEFELDEAPAPQRLAPSAVAMTAELSDAELDSVSGRFVLLHDPDGVEEWQGSFRAVIFVRAEVEQDLIDDPMLQDVGWSWVTEALTGAGCRTAQLGGTVTLTSGRSYGSMTDRPTDGFIEIRASWTPVEAPDTGEVLDDMGQHVSAWVDLMAQAGGLPPVPQGVALVAGRRRRDRT
jgi:hypothetical protein